MKKLLFISVVAILLITQVSAIEITTEERGENYINLSVSRDTDLVDVWVNGDLRFDDYPFDYVVLTNLTPGTPYLITATTIEETPESATVAVNTHSAYTQATYATVFGLAILMLALGLWVSWFKLASFILATLAELLLISESSDVLMNVAIGIFMVGTLYSFLIDRGFYSKDKR